ELHLVAVGEEVPHVAVLGVEVVLRALRTQLHLLETHHVVLAAAVLLPLERLELEAPVVHEPAHRRLGLRGHLDQVELPLHGELACLLDRHDPERLLGGVVEETHVRDPDLVVDTELTKGDGSWPSSETKKAGQQPLSSGRFLDLQGGPGRWGPHRDGPSWLPERASGAEAYHRVVLRKQMTMQVGRPPCSLTRSIISS